MYCKNEDFGPHSAWKIMILIIKLIFQGSDYFSLFFSKSIGCLCFRRQELALRWLRRSNPRPVDPEGSA